MGESGVRVSAIQEAEGATQGLGAAESSQKSSRRGQISIQGKSLGKSRRRATGAKRGRMIGKQQ